MYLDRCFCGLNLVFLLVLVSVLSGSRGGGGIREAEDGSWDDEVEDVDSDKAKASCCQENSKTFVGSKKRRLYVCN